MRPRRDAAEYKQIYLSVLMLYVPRFNEAAA